MTSRGQSVPYHSYDATAFNCFDFVVSILNDVGFDGGGQWTKVGPALYME